MKARARRVAACATGIAWFALPVACLADEPVFTPVQPDLFAAPGGQSNAWGDFDNDGDLDLVITFRDAPVRLYRNSPGGFADVGAAAGLPTDGGNPRSVAWGDYDNDGDLDIYIAYSGLDEPANRLFRNNLVDGEFGFTEVGEAAGVALRGHIRQVSFVDYDADGDLDLYVAAYGDDKLYRRRRCGPLHEGRCW